MVIRKYPSADLERLRPLFFKIGLIIALGLVLLAFEWPFNPSSPMSYYETVKNEAEYDIIPNTIQKPIMPEVPKPPKVVDKIELIDNKGVQDELFTSNTSEEGSENGSSVFDFDEELPGAEEVFKVVDVMPRFLGGDYQETFRQWLVQNLKYPVPAAERKISGKVVAQFTVNRFGAIEDIIILKGVDPLLDAETIRVISLSPLWEPGRERNKSVKVRLILPVVFMLN